MKYPDSWEVGFVELRKRRYLDPLNAACLYKHRCRLSQASKVKSNLRSVSYTCNLCWFYLVINLAAPIKGSDTFQHGCRGNQPRRPLNSSRQLGISDNYVFIGAWRSRFFGGPWGIPSHRCQGHPSFSTNRPFDFTYGLVALGMIGETILQVGYCCGVHNCWTGF